MDRTGEYLDELRRKAKESEPLRQQLLDTRKAADPLKEFCRISTQAGCPVAPMELILYGEEAYAAMRRSTNGGGENSPLLEGEDDYYELFLAGLS